MFIVYMIRKQRGGMREEGETFRHYYRAMAIDVARAMMRIVHSTAVLAVPETSKTKYIY